MTDAEVFEREVAAALGVAHVTRPLYTSAPDVASVPGWPELRVECKLRATHTHHRWMRETVERYGGTPCVVTRERGSNDVYATVPLDLLIRVMGIGVRQIDEPRRE